MARRKKRTSRKQGLASWGTSVIALGIGLGNVFARATEAGQTWQGFVDDMVQDYTGYSSTGWDASNLMRGYAPIIGAIVFKKATSMLMKSARVKSLLPSLS